MSTNDSNRQQLWTAREVAAYLRFPTMDAFYSWRYRTSRAGTGLRAVKRSGRTLLFDPDDVRRHVDDNRETTP